MPTADDPRTSRGYLYLTVFMAGMTTLAVEFTTSRMLQTVYGTSNIVWANVIGLVLLFLTLGYFIGGRLSDRYPNSKVFYGLITSAGFFSVFFLLLTSLILRNAASALAAVNVGAILSSLIAVIFALAVPITFLGCVSPFAIRLGVRDVSEAGRMSGRIFALSTWGSLLGTYLPVLIVIPLAGTRFAAVGFGLILFFVGLGGLWQVSRRTGVIGTLLLLVLIPFIVIWGSGNIKDYSGQIFETESAYNYVQVVRQGDCNYLLLNEGQAYHSYYCEGGRIPKISVWGLMLAAPHFYSPEVAKEIESAAVIGLAAGTIPKQFSQVYGPVAIDGIELDPTIVQAGRDFFALNEPNINVIIGDGRYELNQLNQKYDVITLDAYKVPYIPWHLTTKEFFGEIKEHLNNTGVLAINVGRVPGDRRLVEALTGTLLTQFPTVHTIDVPGSLNSILFATVQATDPENLELSLASLDSEQDKLLREIVLTATENLVPTVSSELVFSDERAPVEILTDAIVLRYLLESGPTGLPGIGG